MTTEPIETEQLTAKPPATLARFAPFINDFNSAYQFAEMLVKANMAPKGMQPGGVLGIIEAGREIGLPPMVALSYLTFVNGRIGIMGDGAKALIRAAGALKPGTDFEEVFTGEEYTPEWKCTITTWRTGQDAPFVTEFSFKDALAAKLVRVWVYPSDDKDGKWKKGEKAIQAASKDDGWNTVGPWSRYTKRQMKYRALGFHCKDHYSDILLGTVIAEELQDYPEPKETSQDRVTNALAAKLQPIPEVQKLREAKGIPEAEVVSGPVSLSTAGTITLSVPDRRSASQVTAEEWHCPRHPNATTFKHLLNGETCSECGECKQ